MLYTFLADLILLIHFGYVAFVALGLLATWIGYFLRRRWAQNFYFRAAYLACMAIVVAESAFGIECPLTTWENDLRVEAGGASYQESFMEDWIHRLMFFDLSAGTFTIIYVVFFAALVLSLIVIPPSLPAWLRRNKDRSH